MWVTVMWCFIDGSGFVCLFVLFFIWFCLAGLVWSLGWWLWCCLRFYFMYFGLGLIGLGGGYWCLIAVGCCA